MISVIMVLYPVLIRYAYDMATVVAGAASLFAPGAGPTLTQTLTYLSHPEWVSARRIKK